MTWSVSPAEGLSLLRSSLLTEAFPGLVHAVSTRTGGISPAPYESLNLAVGTGDLEENVRENRRRLAEVLTLPAECWAFNRQVLGSAAVRVREDHARGLRENGDALVSNLPRVPLLTFSADCVLVLLFDPVTRSMANLHASRRGSLEDIAGGTVRRLREEFDARPENLRAAIAPSIGPCCYTISAETEQEWRARLDYAGEVLRNGRLDLWKTQQIQLKRAGVQTDLIDSADLCTACRPDLFYSHRRDGEKTGRFGAVIALR